MTHRIGGMTAPRWGVPDWRDEAAYPGPEAPMHEWRWQFLRRRPDYRQFWLDHARQDFERAVRFAEMMREEDPDYPHPEWRCGWMVNASFFGGVSKTLDPAWPHYQPGIFEPRGGDLSAVWRAEYDDHQAALDAGRMTVEFDLNSPIAEQIRRAEKMLRTDQLVRHGELLKSPRHHTTKWSSYLRVIDARDDKQTWATIANEILRYTRKEPQAARQVWEQVQELMFKAGA